eukprot:280572-Prorocentrum_lima.AAC.1
MAAVLGGPARPLIWLWERGLFGGYPFSTELLSQRLVLLPKLGGGWERCGLGRPVGGSSASASPQPAGQ